MKPEPSKTKPGVAQMRAGAAPNKGRCSSNEAWASNEAWSKVGGRGVEGEVVCESTALVRALVLVTAVTALVRELVLVTAACQFRSATLASQVVLGWGLGIAGLGFGVCGL